MFMYIYNNNQDFKQDQELVLQGTGVPRKKIRI